MYETKRIQHRITSGHIRIVADGHLLPAFWAHPEVGATFPGLVLIHEWWGLTPHIRALVRRFAEQGYYVIAPDLFDGQIARTADEGLALQKKLGEAGLPRINAALNVLQTHHKCNGKLGVVGWQLGGELTFQAAMHRSDLRACVVFYARPDAHLVMMPADETPLLVFYGEQDSMASMEMIEKVRYALAHSPGKGKVVSYPGVTTGFFNDELPTYNAQAAKDAWNQMLDFLQEQFEAPLAPNA